MMMVGRAIGIIPECQRAQGVGDVAHRTIPVFKTGVGDEILSGERKRPPTGQNGDNQEPIEAGFVCHKWT